MSEFFSIPARFAARAFLCYDSRMVIAGYIILALVVLNLLFGEHSTKRTVITVLLGFIGLSLVGMGGLFT